MGQFKLELSENSRKVLEKRYLKKDAQGKPAETPEEMFQRVAKNIALAERKYDSHSELHKCEEEFFRVMVNLEFLPNSPTLMNAGRELQQLSACFVLPIEDSMDSIFEAVKDTAMIHKSGGGTGFSFSRLRPKNSMVRSTGGVASGPVSFLKVFDAATQAVKQGGTRRGANMGILRVDHPDILEFITCKENDKEITNFNLSIGITEDFMQKVERDEEYDLIEPHSGKSVGKLRAQEVFELVTKMAHKNGEPGIVFLDRLNKFNPTPKLGEIESTNPCGEQPLLPYESCNLGSLNLSRMITDGKLDWDKLAKTIKIAVHFLDNVIDMNLYPIKKIEMMTKANRKIGLGVMGFADCLIKLGIAYNSEEAVSFSQRLMNFIQEEALKASCELARKRGVFPNFAQSIYAAKNLRLRNATLTTIAPTGTLSIIANCSSGIEPVFAICYLRKVLDKEELIEVHPYFKELAVKEGFYSEQLIKDIAQKASIQDIEEIPVEARRLFLTAHDISPQWHIRMQAAFQKYTDNAVSKTVNFPQEASIKDVEDVYFLAYKLGCKGVTIYRDKSREDQVLNIGEKKTELEKQTSSAAITEKLSPRPRPEITHGTTTKISTGCGNLYVTINEDSEGHPFEVFMQMGKAGGCAASQLEAVGRLISLALRSGLDVKPVIDQLRGIRCPSPSWEKGGRIFSCADAIARVLEQCLGKMKQKTKLQEGETFPEPTKFDSTVGLKVGNVVGVCPDCGDVLRHEEGCVKCTACGYTKC
jgi:ribonucleoside-diphosphate reductase alpha chain